MHQAPYLLTSQAPPMSYQTSYQQAPNQVIASTPAPNRVPVPVTLQVRCQAIFPRASLSHMPSSMNPSNAPSTMPSDVPGTAPSESHHPSSKPGGIPSSLVPSISTMPSQKPGGSPSVSSMPSQEPSGSPSISSMPSQEPKSKGNLKTPVKTRTLHLSEPYDSRHKL